MLVQHFFPFFQKFPLFQKKKKPRKKYASQKAANFCNCAVTPSAFCLFAHYTFCEQTWLNFALFGVKFDTVNVQKIITLCVLEIFSNLVINYLASLQGLENWYKVTTCPLLLKRDSLPKCCACPFLLSSVQKRMGRMERSGSFMAQI